MTEFQEFLPNTCVGIIRGLFGVQQNEFTNQVTGERTRFVLMQARNLATPATGRQPAEAILGRSAAQLELGDCLEG